MKKMKEGKSIWVYVLIITALIYSIMLIFELTFVNFGVQFFFQIILFIVFAISLNKTLREDAKGSRIVSICFCIAFIIIQFLSYEFFKSATFLTLINVNDRQIAVQEHFVLNDYRVKFYKVKLGLLKIPVKDGPFFYVSSPAFHNGRYSIIEVNNTTVTIEYRDFRYDGPQRITVNY